MELDYCGSDTDGEDGGGITVNSTQVLWVMSLLTAAPDKTFQPEVLPICRASGPLWPGN